MELKWLSPDEVIKLFEDSLAEIDYKQGNFKYLHLNTIHNANSILVAFKESTVGTIPVGFVQLQLNPKDANVYWMNFICVHPQYQKQGIAKALLTEMVRFVSKIQGASLELSSYEVEGEVLIDSVCALATEYPSLTIKHRTWSGGGYQNAAHVFVREGDMVWVECSEFSGPAQVILIHEDYPLTLMVKHKEEGFKILASEITKKQT